ncbi:MAG: hypothetical protein HY301_03335 [Verrucomicrobia bacterium]|nr:hypothetical protein [Verrucomicrobiota bacterium]
MFVADKVLSVADKTLFVADKPLFVADKPLFVADKPLFVTDKTLFATDKPLSVAGKTVFSVKKAVFVAKRALSVMPKPQSEAAATPFQPGRLARNGAVRQGARDNGFDGRRMTLVRPHNGTERGVYAASMSKGHGGNGCRCACER